MMRRKQVFSLFALVAPVATAALLAAPIAPSTAAAEERLANLCEVARGECSPTPRLEATPFDGEVCWDGATVTVRGAGGCADGRPFALYFGVVVDPVDNIVLPLLPVADACDAGYCVPGKIDAGGLKDEGGACCNPETKVCKSADDGTCTSGEILWCKDREDNGDGTVTCHDPS